MASPRGAVFLRTYVWDDYTFRSATRVWDRCGGLDFFILADETRSGPLETSPFRKIAHTAADFEALGLPCLAPHARSPLWWSCDYGLYDAVLKLPGYDYYCFIESDVSVNLELRHLVEQVASQRLGFVTCFDHRPIQPSWPHAWSCADMPFGRKSWTPLCIMLASEAVAMHLLGQRQRLATLRNDGRLTEWPFCEGFVSSALMDAGVAVGSLTGIADLTHFGTESIFLEIDPQIRVAGSLCHAVLDPERFWTKLISRTFNALLARGHYSELRRIRESLIGIGRPDYRGWQIRGRRGNLALDRSARQSSCSQWSRKPHSAHPAPEEADARGANCGVLTGGHGFHTGSEDHPWWAVDLGSVCMVDEVVIFNGRRSPERARRLLVETSSDGEQWSEVYRKGDDRIFSGNDDPLIFRLPQAVAARHVRVVLDGTGPLHLDEIEVYGPQ